MKLIKWLTLAGLAGLATSKDTYSHEDYVVIACKSAVEATATFCEGKSKGYDCACSNPAELGSWISCVYNNTGKYDPAADNALVDFCNKYKFTVDSIHSAYENATKYMVNISNVKGFKKKTMINYPITGGNLTKNYQGYYWGNFHRWNNVAVSHYLGIASLSAWALLIVVCAFINWSLVLLPSLRRKLVGPATNFWRKHIALPAVFGGRHMENFGLLGLFPDRFESIVLSIFFIYSFLANAILGFTYYEGDLVFKTKSTAYARYIGDRSAILLSYLVPLLFGFPGRNNIMQWVTRWPYSRFVTFHKGLGRILGLEVLVHSIAMTIQSFALGKWHTRIHAVYFQHGIAATVCCWVAMGFAAYGVRRYWYELFLVSHIVLIAMFLWTAWLHAASQDYGKYYYACAAIWCFDRAVRIARVVLFGVRTAKCEILEKEGTIKLSVPYPKSYWKPSPAAHGFVYFLTPRTFWQSHPFTLIDSITDKSHIHFYCKIKGGVTKLMGHKVKNHGHNVFNVKVLVEGPYGLRNPYHQYDKAVLIAGGNGIPGPFSYALDLVSREVKTEVKLYWAVREYNSLNWFKEELMQFKGTNCRPIIYVSNPNSSIAEVDTDMISSSGSSVEFSEEKNSEREKISEQTLTLESLQQAFDYVEFRRGRIDIDQLVQEEISNSTGSVAFGICAHPNMTDNVRAAVIKNLDNKKRIDYFEEMQTW
ncbi:hypothetical protein KL905_001310 [Ogataea polymorpha]|uniref:uncharacterized protein n=1 Tax=Ogataea polymorpha TaxID=460523 RepID=UPI0007F4D887|nr:uncharacterized protein OGAPODRAFT_75275 [Ogataea polymorpha]KAG7896903.1 hypothetical protein KL908_000305 [Ogataea polymorpha]KAG7912102.1 hypothetical protein KL906_000306 [Ogataea polymorpha]KAG7913326.1 hypothetical protein KL907_000271 [Ogataea polymorpha]KAG7923044.1 hypothetical protein KL905_001310 [Ogataea polymorpha]KAG7938241.1 hypothetical protein KL934_000815 [Ogataea polymorpha]